MCIADIAISRRCNHNRTFLDVLTPVRLAPNPDRVALYVGLPATTFGVCGIALTEADAIAAKYVTQAACNIAAMSDMDGGYMCYLDYRNAPSIIHGELWVKVGGDSSYYVEVTMNDDLANELRQYLKEQRGKYGRK